MNIIYRIAKLELSTLFYSPVAWLVLIIFIFQSGLTFSDVLENLIRNQSLGYPSPLLTNQVFAMPPMGVFPSVQSNLYLYIPLLTMGLMSRELSSGTIKLLLSSPVRIRAIVLGKFLAMAAYGFLLILILAAFTIVAHFTIESFDFGLVISGLLGLYLLICAYSAIGLFMSSLTPYQVVAAISTLVVFAVLRYVGQLGQSVDVLREITHYLSISGRSDALISGLISSKDVLYFIIVIVLFLTITILKLRADRESKPVRVKTTKYVMVVMAALVMVYMSSRSIFTYYIDMTATKRLTLTPNSQDLVKRFDEPLKMKVFVNLLDNNGPMGFPESRIYDLQPFESYIRFMPNLEVDYIYYYDKSQNEGLYKYNPGLDDDALAKLTAESYNQNLNRYLTPAEIKKQINLLPEENRLVRLLEYKGKKVFLRMFEDMMVYPSEQEISAALKQLISPSPNVLFLHGKDERSIGRTGDDGYKTLTSSNTFRYSLINQGFKVDTLKLQPGVQVPDDIAVLVIADPRRAYTAYEKEAIQQYIQRGGNLLVAGEPNRRELINELIAPLGAEIAEGIIVQKSTDNAPDFVLANFKQPDQGSIPVLQNFYQPGAKVSLKRTASLHVTDTGSFTFYPLLVTDPATTWNKAQPLSADSVAVNYAPAEGDLKTELPVALAATRLINGKEQRLAIVGDADFLGNAELGRQNMQTANFSFSTNLFKWFSYGAFPIDTSRPATSDNKVLIEKSQLPWLKTALLGILPGLITLFGLVTLFRRKRK